MQKQIEFQAAYKGDNWTFRAKRIGLIIQVERFNFTWGHFLRPLSNEQFIEMFPNADITSL